jgi:arylsulfatase A-like enzyme
MADNTYIIFTSDHGDQMGSHQMTGKGLFYDEVCHIPFIVTHPDFHCGRVDSVNLISNGLDMIPSVLELAGIEADPALEGKSIVPLLRDAKHRLERDVIPVEFVSGMGIITKDFYYGIYLSGKANNEQLYDMRKRPLQMVNDALDSTYNEVLQKLRSQFEEEHRKTLERYGHPQGFTKYVKK